MKSIIRSAVLGVALAASCAAQATTFKFSYSFLNDVVVTGSFDGTANGNLVTGISNVFVFLNGQAFADNGSLYLTGRYDAYEAPVVSFDGLSSNFIFANNKSTPDASDLFTVAPSHYGGTTNYAEVRSFSGAAMESADDGRVQAHWNLVAVPEPETYALLLAGLGLLGVAARRKRAAV